MDREESVTLDQGMRTHSRLVLAGIVALALAVRLVVALGLATDEPDDGRLYTRLAHNLAVEGVYSIDTHAPFHPTYIRVPGYPLFVAAVYRLFGDWNNTAVRAAQAVIDTATCALVALLAWWWAPPGWPGDRRWRAAAAAFVLAAACPFPLIYPATLLTETLALFLGTATVCALLWALAGPIDASRGRAMARWSSVGALAGLAALVRPENGLYLAVAGALLIVTAVLAWLRPGAARPRPGVIARAVVNGGGLVLGFAAALAPWTARNVVVFGVFQPLNPQSVSMPDEFVPAGYEAWVRTWIDHPRYVEPFLFALDAAPIDARAMPASAFDDVAERARVETLLGPYNAPAPDADPDDKGAFAPGGMKPALDAGFAELARERVARRPFRQYVALPIRRALALWFNPHADFYPFAGYLVPWRDLDPDRSQQIWLPLFLALLVAWTLAGSAGTRLLWRSPGGGPIVVLLVLLIVPRLVLLAWLPNPEPRYTVEFFPLVSALAGCWLASL